MARSREFLENYFNEITADSERQRRFMLLIRRVDKLYIRKRDELKKLQNEHVEKLQKFIHDGGKVSDFGSVEENAELIKKIKTLTAETQMLANQKIIIAQQSYQKIENEVNRLDKEAIILKNYLESTSTVEEYEEPILTPVVERRGRKRTIHTPAPSLPQTNDGITLDYPPTEEPVYCTCRQVSYGEMIACDGENCAIEWFHYPCVNLTVPPRGKWYCPECRKGRQGLNENGEEIVPNSELDNQISNIN